MQKKNMLNRQKKVGLGQTPPPSMGKIPTFYRFFSGGPPLYHSFGLFVLGPCLARVIGQNMHPGPLQSFTHSLKNKVGMLNNFSPVSIFFGQSNVGMNKQNLGLR